MHAPGVKVYTNVDHIYIYIYMFASKDPILHRPSLTASSFSLELLLLPLPDSCSGACTTGRKPWSNLNQPRHAGNHAWIDGFEKAGIGLSIGICWDWLDWLLIPFRVGGFHLDMRWWYGTFLPPGYAVQATAGTNDGGNDGVDQNWPWKLVLELVDIWACTNWALVLR